MNGATVAIKPAEQLFYGKPLIFNEKRHMYFWGGEHVPSVTTITKIIDKPALLQWAANMAVEHVENAFKQAAEPFLLKPIDVICAEARKAHTRKRDAAADKGTTIHAFARDCFIARHLMPVPQEDEEVKRGCEAFCEWFRTHQTYAIGVERRVFSQKHKYAGTTDFFGRINGKLGVMDIKTSGGIYPEHWLQVTGYELALVEEQELQGPLTRWILHLDKTTGAFKLYEKAMSAVHIHAWVSVVMFHRYWRMMEKDCK